MTKQATLYRMVTDEHICPYGLKALDLLQRNDFDLEDRKLDSRAATDQFKQEHGVDTTPQIFIDGERIGGYDALREYLGLDAANEDGDQKTYTPVIATFALTALMSIAMYISLDPPGFAGAFLHYFVAFSMCVLAVYKLRDLESFSNQFITYDLLAMRVVRYSYVYPFAEAFVGVGMLTGAMPLLVAIVALTIGGIGAVSVVKAVYIDKRDLKCACVGGDSNVPLGFISLSENLMMVGMGSWKLLTL